MIANSIIGIHVSIGAGDTRVMSLNQPPWKRATTMPYAAPIDSRFMITAFTGTNNDRNTTMSSRNESASTATKKYGSRPARWSEKSTLTATVPLTLTSSVVLDSTGGSTGIHNVSVEAPAPSR